MSPRPGDLRHVNFGEGELADALRAYVMPPDRLPAGVADGAPGVLPGLVVATALLRADRVNFLPTTSILELGGDAVWARAVENVRNLAGVQVIRELDVPGRNDTELVTMWGDEPFVASRVVVLGWLVDQLYGAPPAHGVLVAVPSRTRLVVHVPTGMGVAKVVGSMAMVARHWFEGAVEDERISPDVFFVSNENSAQRLTSRADEETLIDMTSRPFSEVLARFVPGFHA